MKLRNSTQADSLCVNSSSVTVTAIGVERVIKVTRLALLLITKADIFFGGERRGGDQMALLELILCVYYLVSLVVLCADVYVIRLYSKDTDSLFISTLKFLIWPYYITR